MRPAPGAGVGVGVARGPLPQVPCPTCGAPKLCVSLSRSCGFPGYGTWASAAEGRLHGRGGWRVTHSSWLWPPHEVPRTLRAPLRASGWACMLETDCTAVCKQSFLGGTLNPGRGVRAACGGWCAPGEVCGRRQLFFMTRGAWGYILVQKEPTSATISSGLVPLSPAVPTTACSWGANLGLYALSLLLICAISECVLS